MSYYERDCETGCSECSNICVHVCWGVVDLVVGVLTFTLVCVCVCMSKCLCVCVFLRVNVIVLH